MKMKLLQKKGSLLAAMFAAVTITSLGLAQQVDAQEAEVAWLLNEDDGDAVLSIRTNGGVMKWNPGFVSLALVANDGDIYFGDNAGFWDVGSYDGNQLFVEGAKGVVFPFEVGVVFLSGVCRVRSGVFLMVMPVVSVRARFFRSVMRWLLMASCGRAFRLV